jgi:hypothetical protein
VTELDALASVHGNRAAEMTDDVDVRVELAVAAGSLAIPVAMRTGRRVIAVWIARKPA